MLTKIAVNMWAVEWPNFNLALTTYCVSVLFHNSICKYEKNFTKAPGSDKIGALGGRCAMREIVIEKPYAYERKAFYYETDQMGIVHHSNYIRWMEEARIAYMEYVGLPYKAVEEKHILIPVLEAQCEYKNYVRFDETVEIYPKVTFFNGIRMTLEYDIVEKETGKLCACGRTRHCFTTPEMKPVSLKKTNKEMYDIFMGCLVSGEKE